ncbi:rhodanese-like domain-containing protein [Selenihalanaerobacter shriftii]|uniref:Rhodanese-related sulfurtransferase n=1 Tax=Selenihalanaerobacter shriftii TaxID=142842 RepID=A0A1T4JQV9_9FIRM|nr:rhodanese-like domain-containing protein [Selenihalanaerobacter shriftii]SJZ32485.1 Rhodanese-related sulfurtransferase [Selenihalanaerobacter shriftii]
MHKKRLILVTLVIVMIFTFSSMASAASPQVKKELTNYLNNIPEDFDVIFARGVNFKLKTGKDIFVLDVREPAEYKSGHIPTAVNIPIRSVMDNLDQLPNKETLIVAYCKTGIRAAYVTEALQVLGYNAKDLVMGIEGWEESNLPIQK